jgi:hypothetical protein
MDAVTINLTDSSIIALALYLPLPMILTILALIKRNVGVILAAIIGLASTASPIADTAGSWVFAPIVLLIITLAIMAARDMIEGRVEL